MKEIIKNVLNRNLFFPLYYQLDTRYQLFNKKIVIKYLTRKYHVNSINAFNAKNIKKSDTLFVLGSGSSVNKLSKDQIEEIKNKDSIGFNFWLIHDIIPTYYMFEFPRDKDRRDIFFDIWKIKQKEYKDIPIFIKSAYKNSPINRLPKVLLKNIYLTNDITIPGNKLTTFRKALIKLNKRENMLKNNSLDILYKKRASVAMLLFLAFKLGYKNIVLTGIDLNNTKYFYEEDNKYYRDKGIPIPDTGQTSLIHKTNTPQLNNLVIEDVINMIDHYILKNNNVNLYLANKSSLLYPKLPLYFE